MVLLLLVAANWIVIPSLVVTNSIEDLSSMIFNIEVSDTKIQLKPWMNGVWKLVNSKNI